MEEQQNLLALTVRLDQGTYNDITRIAFKYDISYAAVARILLALSLGGENLEGLSIAEQLIIKDMTGGEVDWFDGKKFSVREKI